MKTMYFKERKYTIEEVDNDWVILRCDGEFICRVVSFEEARRVIYMYWNNLGVDMDYLTEDDFDEIDDD